MPGPKSNLPTGPNAKAILWFLVALMCLNFALRANLWVSTVFEAAAAVGAFGASVFFAIKAVRS